MSGTQVKVIGRERLHRTMTAAAREMGEMRAANAQAARIIAAAARARTPRRSGRLAASLRAEGGPVASVGSPVVYAGPIHWGWPARHIRPSPFLTSAAADTEPAWLGAYRDELQDILNGIQGA